MIYMKVVTMLLKCGAGEKCLAFHGKNTVQMIQY